MIATATQTAEKMSKLLKSTHADILSMWVESILDEVQDRILNKESAGGDDIIDIISNVKEEISQ